MRIGSAIAHWRSEAFCCLLLTPRADDGGEQVRINWEPLTLAFVDGARAFSLAARAGAAFRSPSRGQAECAKASGQLRSLRLLSMSWRGKLPRRERANPPDWPRTSAPKEACNKSPRRQARRARSQRQCQRPKSPLARPPTKTLAGRAEGPAGSRGERGASGGASARRARWRGRRLRRGRLAG